MLWEKVVSCQTSWGAVKPLFVSKILSFVRKMGRHIKLMISDFQRMCLLHAAVIVWEVCQISIVSVSRIYRVLPVEGSPLEVRKTVGYS